MSADPSRSAWRPVFAYTALSAANQMLWLTFAPITTGAARHYGVSDGAIGWLAEIFPLLYVVFALPTGRLIDRRLSRWLGLGAALTAVGALLRLAGDGYGSVLAGQLLIALAQPLVLSAVLPVCAAYLAPRDRPTGVAVSSAGVFAGMLLALVSGAVFGAQHVGALLAVQAAFAVLTAVLLGMALLRTPAAATRAVLAAPRLRVVWADRYLRLLVGLACVGFGVFIALTTWLQTLLHPAGVSDDAAGIMLLAMVIAGVLGSALVPPLLARRHSELRFVVVSVIVGVAGLVLLAAAPGVATGLLVLTLIGAFLLTDLPVLLELAQRRAGEAGGTAGALVWLAGNAAGLVAALIVQALLHRPSAAFLVLAALLVAGLPLVAALGRQGSSVRV